MDAIWFTYGCKQKPFPHIQCDIQRETLGCWDAKVMLAQQAGEEICDLAEAECREERWETLGTLGH